MQRYFGFNGNVCICLTRWMIKIMALTGGGGAVRNCSTRSISVQELNLFLLALAAKLEETRKKHLRRVFNRFPSFASSCLVKTLPLGAAFYPAVV